MRSDRHRDAQPYRIDAAALRRQRALNRVHSTIILFGLMALAACMGFVLAGIEGVIVGILIAGAGLLVGSVSGTAMFRRIYGAIALDMRNAPDLVLLLGELARRAGLARAPTLHLLPSRLPQAMSAGEREEPAVAVTLGLLQVLPPRELAAVLAHEVAHVRHGDAFVMRLAAAAGTLTQTMSTIGIFLLIVFLPVLVMTGEAFVSPLAIVLLIFSPVVGDLLQLALSRRREFLADAGAVELTGDPVALAAALQRLERLRGDDWERFPSRGRGRPHWFRTHPSTKERIDRLLRLVPPARPDLPLATQPSDLRQLFGGHDPRQRRFARPFRR
ncbi:MAG: zinc metalloprotease HtpX [Alphaproteobacteria bacterium]